MEKFKYIPLGLLVVYVSKLIILGNASFVDSPIILVLSLLTAFYEFKLERTKLLDMSKKIEELDKEVKIHYKKVEDLSTYVATQKIGQQYRLNQSK